MTETPQGDGDDSGLDYNHLRDCTVLWAVSVPGETDWYQSISDGHPSTRGEFSREFPTWVPYGSAVDRHITPIRAHKYPIPGGAHLGVQIKVSPSGYT